LWTTFADSGEEETLESLIIEYRFDGDFTDELDNSTINVFGP
jgi:hypothetical protein